MTIKCHSSVSICQKYWKFWTDLVTSSMMADNQKQNLCCPTKCLVYLDHTICCDLVESVGSWENWLWDTARKRNEFLWFSAFWESFNCYNFGTTGLIQMGFSAKFTSPNEDFNQIENWKCHMLDFRLIPLDRITYHISNKSIKSHLLLASIYFSITGYYFNIEIQIQNSSVLCWKVRWF